MSIFDLDSKWSEIDFSEEFLTTSFRLNGFSVQYARGVMPIIPLLLIVWMIYVVWLMISFVLTYVIEKTLAVLIGWIILIFRLGKR